MDIGEAVHLLKEGYPVRRKGWNGKGMFLLHIRGDEYQLQREQINEGLVGIEQLAWIGMKTADGGFVPWLCSQTDLLARDWEVAG